MRIVRLVLALPRAIWAARWELARFVLLCGCLWWLMSGLVRHLNRWEHGPHETIDAFVDSIRDWNR